MDLLGFGGWLTALIGICVGVVGVIFYYLIFAPYVRRWMGADSVLTTMDLVHRTHQPAEQTLDDALQDALYPMPEGDAVNDLDPPEMFVPGVEALPRRPAGGERRPTR